MTTSSQDSGAAYLACVDEVLRQSPLLIDRWCSRLVEAMHARSMAMFDPAERHQLQNAIAALKKNRALIVQRFPDELKKTISDEAAAGFAKKSVSPARSLASVSFDKLELMGDSQVQEAVESARSHQIIRLTCETALAGFSARLSTAQGFLVVKADSNPLRPEIMIQAFFGLLQVLPLTSQVRSCWLLDAAQLLGEELQLLYVLLDNFLAAQGIAPAAYGVIASPESKSARALQYEKSDAFQVSQVSSFNEGFREGYRSSGLAALDDPTQTSRNGLLTLDRLHHLLAGDYDNSFHLPLFSDDGTEAIVHHEFSHTLPAALEVLADLEEKGLVKTRENASRLAPPQPLVQMRAHLKTGAKSFGQSLAVEVVELMIEQIANDDRLLMPVRQVIANAEPAFLRLAVMDPRFFNDKNHPARRLLDTITSTSLGYASENATGFSEFMQNLQEVAVLLTEEHASDAQHFADLLQDFERRQARDTPEHRQSQNRAVQALLRAEQRNLLAVKIAAEIKARPDFVAGNRVIASFLTGPWAQVMAKERLLGEYAGSGSAQAVFGMTLGNVLWSLDIAQVSSHRKRLLKIIPDILKSLREGLLSIDFPLEQSRAFFDEVMAIHQAGLKTQPNGPSAALQSSHTLGKMFVAEEEESDVAQLWLAPTEVQHSGFMEDWDKAPNAGPDELFPQDNAAPAGAALPGSSVGIELHLGDWVEVFVDLQWLRAQLTWVSPHNTLFMFTSEGGRKHSMTARVLQNLLKLKMVKVVSQQGVLDGALDSVARTALRNSVQGEDGF